MNATWQSLTEPLALELAAFPMLMLVGLPALTFALALLLGSDRERWSSSLALASMTFCFGLSLYLLASTWSGEVWHWRFVWIDLTGAWFDQLPLQFTGGLRADRLASLMSVLVTGIALLVHMFSLSYMRGERHLNRYWAYLGLFSAAMLLIVLADNLLFIYFGWELVGASSYFLIGFWYQREIPARASQKAFLVNRIGDLGFLLGMLILLAQGGTLDLAALTSLAEGWSLEQGEWRALIPLADGTFVTRTLDQGWLTSVGILLFGGCIGKSAQFPLQVWLPDAMAGPTPVSSLIHAATMVAAGVYLMARVYFLLDETALVYLAITGGLTALLAALAALAQWDIKRVLAYSTISQLGYMVMALGVGARDMALLHLFTHAFFKCALFLSAGAVIHQLHRAFHGLPSEPDAQDLRAMGGLRRHLPVTFWLYMLPMLALAGLPLTSGFLSKDGILVASWTWAESYGGMAWLLPVVSLITAGLTAFYMTRHAWLIWGGESVRGLAEQPDAPAPSAPGALMRIPLAVLALGSLWLLFGLNPLAAEQSWLMPAFAGAKEPLAVLGRMPLVDSHAAHLVVPILSVGLATAGLALGTWRYRHYRSEKLPQWLQNHFYQDQLYTRLVVAPVLWFSRALAWFDRRIVDGLVNLIGGAVVHRRKELPLPSLSHLAARFDLAVIDGLVNGVVAGVGATGRLLRKVQSGKAQQYLLMALLGILLMVAAWLV
jgi:NADH-quinone oxidoreductase subunit L